MKKFKNWVFKNHLYEMSKMGLGQHKDKEIQLGLPSDTGYLTTSYLQWAVDNVKSGPALKKLPEIKKELETRKNKPYKSNAPQPNNPKPDSTQPNAPQPNISANKKSWTLAVSLKIQNVKPGDIIAVSPVDNGSKFEYEDENGNNGILDKETISSFVKSIRDANGKAIIGNNALTLIQSNKKEDAVVDDEISNIQSNKSESGRPKPNDVKFPPDKMSIYNKNIESKFLEGGNLMIDALAGTGKTSQLKHLSSFVKPGEKWLYLVFNKKNQVESKESFPEQIDVFTTHAFLGNVLKRARPEFGGSTNLPLGKEEKLRKIADDTISISWPKSKINFFNKKGEETSPFHWKAKNIVITLASLCKAYGMHPKSPDFEQKILNIIKTQETDMDLSTEKEDQDRDYTPDMFAEIKKLLNYSLPRNCKTHKEFLNTRDQDDTLWFTALYADQINWKMGYKVVLLDEVQDFNNCQLIMTRKFIEAGAKVVAVGDPNQSLYLFRGASPEAFNDLKSIIGTKPEPLPINYRSGGTIIDWVCGNTHVNNLQSSEANKGLGEVYAAGGTHPPLSQEEFLDEKIQEFKFTKNFKNSTAMICRSNAPLANVALNLLKNDVDFQIVGKDLSKEMVNLIRKVCYKKINDKPIEDLSNILGNFVESVQRKWTNKISKRKELDQIVEYAEIIYSIISYLEEKDFKETPESAELTSVADLIKFIQKKLGGLDIENAEDYAKLESKNPNSYMTLTTAHKSKGLEWDTVFVMEPDKYKKDPKDDEKVTASMQQDRNAWFVAVTRGKEQLFIERSK